MLSDGLGVGDDGVHGLLSVDVGVVLVHAAVGAGDGFGEEAKNGEDEEKDDERGPVVDG